MPRRSIGVEHVYPISSSGPSLLPSSRNLNRQIPAPLSEVAGRSGARQTAVCWNQGLVR